MEWAIRRLWPVPDKQVDGVTVWGCVTGVFEIDGDQHFYTLEDTVRENPNLDTAEWKIAGHTAIPRGRYKVTLTWCHRFQKLLPMLNDVPGFGGIFLHGGNTEKDTMGCPLVGTLRINERTIAECAPAISYLIKELQQAYSANCETWITIQ